MDIINVSNNQSALEMLPWGESTTLSEELIRESAHGAVPRLLLAVQVDNDGDSHGNENEDVKVMMPTKVFLGFCLLSR